MKKGLALFLCLLLMASMVIIPMPSAALDYGVDSDLSNVNASFWGEDAWDSSGGSVAGAGDVNGDGYDDILIGANGDEDGGDAAGQTYLILGKASGWVMDTDLSAADASFWGEDAGDASGYSVAGAGDVNGDGYDDILIGAYQDDDGGGDAGQTYLILGKASGWAMDTDLSSADASFWGEDAGDWSGSSVAGAGDMNGDGYDDILIGAYGDDDDGAQAGQTYLILGKASGWAMDTDLSNADASFWGEDSGDHSGLSVAGAGDVNGDGYDDILIGASADEDGGNWAGQTYLVLGKAAGWAMDTDLSSADASFWGEDADDASGLSVAGAGDVNGDGYDDILIGASGDEDGGNWAGQTYLVLGKASGWTMDSDLSAADASFWGEDGVDYSGDSVAGAGDVNGDGYDDILIGAWGDEDGGGHWAGQTYLVLGKASGWAMDTDLSNADASFWGEDASDYSGYSVAGAGDVNGDGYDDILIGACRDDDGGADAGQTYLIFPDSNFKQTIINSVKAYSDSGYSTEIVMAEVNDTVFIELQGTDGNSSRKDIALVNVTSNESSPLGFRLRLIESGLNTGKYRGNFTIKNRTHEDHRWINASEGETINISSIQDPSKYVSLFLGTDFTLFPLKDNDMAQEDELYLEHYFVLGWTGVTWVFDTNASWLEWNETAQNLSGTPDNGDIGSYWVRINVTNGIGDYDEHNFTLIVNNTPPEINTSDVTTTLKDVEYSIDYNSTDDGQGTITWHLDTDADDWLSIDSVSGILNGTPTNDHVGDFYVNVSVDDGNGGWDWSNFSLLVSFNNFPPLISTIDVTTASEDREYFIDYDVTDKDQSDTHKWSLDTDANWLRIEENTGILKGIPDNSHVGLYSVVITVQDSKNATDTHSFTLEVINSPPRILTADLLTAMEDQEYMIDYASDDDGQGTVTWYLSTNASCLVINATTGNFSATPLNDDVGFFWVNISVEDGNSGWDWSNFTLIVLNTNDPPEFISTPPLNTKINSAYSYDVNASDIDKNDELYYSLVKYPKGMVLDNSSGLITWIPIEGQEGSHEIIIEVTDTYVIVNQTFILHVKPQIKPEPPSYTTTVNEQVPCLMIIVISIIVTLLLLTRDFWKSKRKKKKSM